MDKQRGLVISVSAAIVLLSIRERLRGTDKDVRWQSGSGGGGEMQRQEFFFPPLANCDFMYDLSEHESGKSALATGP